MRTVIRVYGFAAEAATGTLRIDNVAITADTPLPVELRSLEVR